MMKLKDKVAIVTGGSRDIGREVSRKLAREGARVAINYFHEPDMAKETLELVQQEGGEAIVVRGDMTRAEDVKLLLEESRKAFGPQVHVLVNVAGGLVARKLLTEMEESFWNQVISLNLTSVFLACREIVPAMAAGGSIINFSSQAGRDGGGPGSAAYAAAKGGVTTYTRALAKELGPRGIRVNAVCPGMIATTFHDTFTRPEVRAHVAGVTPLRREGLSGEVADLVAYLASEEAAFITGANIDINGGTFFS
jgi:3-oxoacyl-[acyl-carrier protein] reductase